MTAVVLIISIAIDNNSNKAMAGRKGNGSI
jgi:hypothetical protein